MSDRKVLSDRSQLPGVAGEEKLSAPLRQVPGNYAAGRAQRVLGLLANRLKCTSALPVQITRRSFERLFSVIISALHIYQTVGGCFELFRVMQLVAQGFHDEAGQRIRNCIRR